MGGSQPGAGRDVRDPGGDLQVHRGWTPGRITLAAAHRNKLIRFDQRVDRCVSCDEFPKQDTIQMTFFTNSYFRKEGRGEEPSVTTDCNRRSPKRIHPTGAAEREP